MALTHAKEWALSARPVGLPKTSDFALKETVLAAPGAGEIQVRNSFVSVDPYMRGRMYDRPSYVPPFAIGESLTGGAVGKVEVSNHPDYKPGDVVVSMMGWRSSSCPRIAGCASKWATGSKGKSPTQWPPALSATSSSHAFRQGTGTALLRPAWTRLFARLLARAWQNRPWLSPENGAGERDR